MQAWKGPNAAFSLPAQAILVCAVGAECGKTIETPGEEAADAAILAGVMYDGMILEPEEEAVPAKYGTLKHAWHRHTSESAVCTPEWETPVPGPPPATPARLLAATAD